MDSKFLIESIVTADYLHGLWIVQGRSHYGEIYHCVPHPNSKEAQDDFNAHKEMKSRGYARITSQYLSLYEPEMLPKKKETKEPFKPGDLVTHSRYQDNCIFRVVEILDGSKVTAGKSVKCVMEEDCRKPAFKFMPKSLTKVKEPETTVQHVDKRPSRSHECPYIKQRVKLLNYGIELGYTDSSLLVETRTEELNKAIFEQNYIYSREAPECPSCGNRGCACLRRD